MTARNKALEANLRMAADHLGQLFDGLLREAACGFKRQRFCAEAELKNQLGIAGLKSIQISLIDVRSVNVTFFRAGLVAPLERRRHVGIAHDGKVYVG